MNSTNKTKKKRIWELDVIRGIAILGVVFVHVVYDLNYIFGVKFDLGPVFDFIQHYGSLIFIVLSGICVTLGRHHFKRGLIVFGGGVIISAVTYTMVFLKMLSPSAAINFGILSLLGFSMIAYIPFSKMNKYFLLLFGAVAVVLGIVFDNMTVENPYLFPLGLTTASYAAGDYFPIFPNFGYFLIGAFIGKTAYKNKTSLFPKVNNRNIIIRVFSFLGRQSLWIYLAHQPLAYLILSLIFA